MEDQRPASNRGGGLRDWRVVPKPPSRIWIGKGSSWFLGDFFGDIVGISRRLLRWFSGKGEEANVAV